MASSDIQREIAETLRQNAGLVDKYLDYARHYASLCVRAARLAGYEVFGVRANPGEGVVLLASIPLHKENPTVLRHKLETLERDADVQFVFVCDRTMTVYVFGKIIPTNTPTPE